MMAAALKVAATGYGGGLDHATLDGKRTLCGRQVYKRTSIRFPWSRSWSCKLCLRASDKRNGPDGGRTEGGDDG